MQVQMEEQESDIQIAKNQAIIDQDEIKGLRERLKQSQKEVIDLQIKVEEISSQMGVPKADFESVKS